MYQFLVISIAILISSSSWAQSNTPATTAPAQEVKEDVVKDDSNDPNAGKPQKIERMEVTGSHIKRIAVEGPSPIKTIDRKVLEKSAHNSVADVLRETSTASFGGSRPSAGAGGASGGAATTTLRGMSSDTILVLLDGRRLPTIGGSSTVDLNLIPMAAIERVDVLKDGASATYGSDALGGVINFVTKKNYNGAQISFKYNNPEEKGGQSGNVTATYGKSGDNYSVLGVLNYSQTQPLYLRDRNYGRLSDVSLFSPRGSPGSWKLASGGSFNPAADCPPENIFNGRCQFNYALYTMNVPQLKQINGILSATYDITPELKVFGKVIGIHRQVFQEIAPPPDSFDDATATGGLNTTISQAVANTNFGLGSATGPINVFYRLVEEAGTRQNQTKTNSYGAQTGVMGYFTDTWEWESGLSYMTSDNRNEGVSGFANKETLFNMANAGTFNPFAPSGSKSNISAALYKPLMTVKSSIGGADFKTSGELFQMGESAASMAIGFSGFWQTYKEDSDETTKSKKQWGGGTVAVGNGQRNFQSIFTEFGLPFTKELEVQVAGRFDKYSDFGNTLNPKIGLKFNPIPELMIRSSWGTGFKAPTLSELYQGQSAGYPKAVDAVLCPPGTPDSDPNCALEQRETLSSGNRNLKQETSDSFNFGVIVEPVKSLSFGVDYYTITQKNVVSSLASDEGLTYLFQAESTLGASYLQNTYGIEVVRDPGTNQIIRVIAPNVNVAARNISGLDLNVNLRNALWGNWNLNTNIEQSFILVHKENPFPGVTAITNKGLAGYPAWRNTVSFSFYNPTHNIGVLVSTIPGQKQFVERSIPGCCGMTKDYTQVDLNYSYKGFLAEQGTLVVGVQNAFGTSRPFDYSNFDFNGYLNNSLYDPYGRSYFMGYTYNF